MMSENKVETISGLPPIRGLVLHFAKFAETSYDLSRKMTNFGVYFPFADSATVSGSKGDRR